MKIATVALVLVLALGVVACGSSETTTTELQTTTTTAEPATTTTAALATTTEAPTTTLSQTTTTTALSEFFTTHAGEGSKVLDLGAVSDGRPFILHLVCNGGADVKPFSNSGQEVYGGGSFSIPRDGSYDGRVLAAPETSKLQVNATGNWTVAVQPLTEAKQLETPGTITGKSDEIIYMAGSPSSLTVSGNPNDEFENFIIHYYQDGSDWGNSLVNELGRYEGVAIVAGTGYLTVKAGAEWSITSHE